MHPGSDMLDAFRAYTLSADEYTFAALCESIRWEEVGKGRQGAILTMPDSSDRVPIVRTTTRYATPAQRFRPLHDRLAASIAALADVAIGFNHALAEVYTNAYTTMGSHSDQMLDLVDDSWIALFSCYQHPERATPPRKLIVESKARDRERREIPLTHQSIVVFSIAANRRFQHRIVLDTSRASENRWLGVTFRTSKTLVCYRDGDAGFADGVRLTLANDEQRREFYALRRRENNEVDFAYPRIDFTVSESDLMPPVAGG